MLKYYTLWGFISIPFDSVSKKYSNWLIFVIHVGFCSWSSFNTLKSFFKAFAFIGFLNSVNVFLYILTCVGTYWLIVYDCYTKRKLQHAFWMICEKISDHFCSLELMQKSNCLTILIAYSIVDVIICLATIFGENVTSPSSKLVHLVFISVIDQRVSFYVFHAKLIEFQLRTISAKLTMISTHESFGVSESFNGRHFKYICNYYELVHQMSERINAIFGWSQLAIIVMSFHSNAAFLNSAYSQTKETFSDIEGVRVG